MLAKAPNARIVSQQHSPVNTPIQEISAARARCDARRRVMYDKALTAGARLLYVVLDDYAGMKREAWPQQSTLAERLGCSDVTIRSQLRELEDAAYLRRRRGQHGVRYEIQWEVPTESRVSVGDPSRPKESSVPTERLLTVGAPAPLYEPGLVEPEVCARCGGTGEREYEAHHQGYLGEPKKTVRRWRGKCGCQYFADEFRRG